MTVHELPHHHSPDGALVHRLLFEWRARCAARHTTWQLTSNRSATALCAAVVSSLEEGAAAPQLADDLRIWATGVSSAPEARATLLCLAEAVSDLVAREFGEFRPMGLDPVLRGLAEEAVHAPRLRLATIDYDAESGCPDGNALGRDLTAAADGGGPDDLTLVVLALDDEADRHEPNAGRETEVDARVAAFVPVLRRSFGPRFPLYRVNRDTFAVVAYGSDAHGLGESILTATCSTGPRFFWGRAELSALGSRAGDSPDLLLMLALADLQFRRRELLGLNRQVVRRRELSVIGSVAAGLLLVAGLAAAVGGSPTSTSAPRQALHGRSAPATPPAAVEPTTTVPPPVVPALSPPAHASVPVAATAPPPSPSPTPNVVLASYRPTPASTTAPPPPPPPPPTTTTTVPSPGHSASAPGHLKKA